MLTEIYIEALLVDEDLADGMWELWESGVIGEQLVLIAWFLIAISFAKQPCRRD